MGCAHPTGVSDPSKKRESKSLPKPARRSQKSRSLSVPQRSRSRRDQPTSDNSAVPLAANATAALNSTQTQESGHDFQAPAGTGGKEAAAAAEGAASSKGTAGGSTAANTTAADVSLSMPSGVSAEMEVETDFHKTYILGKKLGEGSFGEVLRASHRSTDQIVAVKVLDWDKKSGFEKQQTQDTGVLDGIKTPRGLLMAARPSLRTPRGGCSPRGGGASPRWQGSAAARGGASPRGGGASPRGGGSGWGGCSPRGARPQELLNKFHKLAQIEIRMLEKIGKHPNCVEYIHSFREPTRCYIVTELCRGTLTGLLDKRRKLAAPEVQRAFLEMAQGVSHVHEMGVVHRDIKPDNFLIGGEDGRTIKLADFGAATRLPKDGRPMRSILGTAPYMSPEMIGENGYDQRTDVWSLGASWYWMLFADYPFSPLDRTPGKMKAAILFGEPPPTYKVAQDQHGVLEAVPESAAELVRGCLEREVLQRPFADALLRHSFLRDAKTQEAGREPSKYRRGTSSSSTFAKRPGGWSQSDVSTSMPESHMFRSARSSDFGSRHPSKVKPEVEQLPQVQV